MQKNKLLIFLGILLFVVFILTKIEFTNSLDVNISRSIYNFANNAWVTDFFSFITNYTIGTYAGWLIILLVLLLKTSSKTSFIFMISSGVTVAMVEALKFLTQRVRPFFEFSDVQYLSSYLPVNYSFPSGHTALAFFGVYYITKTLKLSKFYSVLLYLLACLVGFSRIYLGAHYFLDVIAGGILGLVVGMLCYKISNRLKL